MWRFFIEQRKLSIFWFYTAIPHTKNTLSINNTLMRYLDKRLGFLAALLFLLTLLSYLPIRHFSFELLSHFRYHYLLAAIIGSLLALLLKRKKLVFLGIALLLVNGVEILPWYMGGNVTQNRKASDTNFTVMLSNVLRGNQEHAKVLAEVKRVNPDVFVIQEMTSMWLREIKSLEKDYPYSLLSHDDGSFGIGVLSKYPLKKKEVIQKHDVLKSLLVQFSVDGQDVSLIAMHPPPPMGQKLYEWRDSQYLLM